jgi:hypothetical protein
MDQFSGVDANRSAYRGDPSVTGTYQNDSVDQDQVARARRAMRPGAQNWLSTGRLGLCREGLRSLDGGL